MKELSLGLMALLYASTGLWHFIQPDYFMKIMPPWVPWPRAVNFGAGIVELSLAAGLCFDGSQQWALNGILVLLAVVFPVNLHMYRDKEAGLGYPKWALLLRLPAQGLLMAWAFIHRT